MIRPGELSPLAAKELTQALADFAQLQTDVKRIVLPSEKQFPAKWTAATFNSTINNWVCTWIEQYWSNSNGQRINKPGGRFGDTTISPAFPAGNGLLPPPTFPVQVMMREAALAVNPVSGLPWGMTYYFDWNCACAGSGSGTGSGGTPGSVVTACCANALPGTLHATFTVTSGTCAEVAGQVMALPYLGNFSGTDVWSGSAVYSGNTWSVFMECNPNGGGPGVPGLALILTPPASAHCGSPSASFVSQSCGPPFSYIWDFTIASSGGTCACNGSVVRVTVTP